MASREEIATALQELQDDQGRLTPAIVVEAARNPESPLHSEFIWDDAKAAERQRLDKARALLRIKVNYSVNHITFRMPQYIRDPEAARGKQGYIATMRLASEEDQAHAALVAEFGRVAAILKRARHIAVGIGLAAEIDALERTVAGLRETLSPEGPAAH